MFGNFLRHGRFSTRAKRLDFTKTFTGGKTMRNANIAVGRYARVTSAARVDVIGKVVRHTPVGAIVRVPNWCADGFYMDWTVRWDELERSTASACKRAEARRG